MIIKRKNDNKVRVIMSNGDIMEVKYKSELLSHIIEGLKAMESEHLDIDPECFTEDNVWSLYEFLLMRHKDDWIVIDDMKDDGCEDKYGTEENFYKEEEVYSYEEEQIHNDDKAEI
jgi:hypothetical protein